MSIFSKALQALGLRVQNGDVPAKKQLVEVKLQTEDCINNKLIYNINNKSVIVITCNGDKFEGNNVEKEQLEQLRTANISEIINILTPKQAVKDDLTEREEKEIVSNFLEVFKDSEDFDVVGKELYFKGIKTIPIPTLITARFVELVENLNNLKVPYFAEVEERLKEEYNSLKMFTLKLLTSPRKESIEQVLSFCKHNDLRISKLGNIIAYRRVNKFKETKEYSNKELLSFVLESVKKVKTWKKGIKNYEIFNDNGLVLHQKDKKHDYNNYIGNLYDLYNNQNALKEETIQLYTSQHSAGKYTFAIGDIYKSDENDIDLDAGQCHSGGLHFASVNYDYSGYGSVPIVVLINPAKTITIPLNELQKGRTTEMKIACINPNEHGVHIDYELIKEADEQYDEYTIEELQKVISQKTLAPLSIQEEITELSIPEVQNITELLKNRIVTI